MLVCPLCADSYESRVSLSPCILIMSLCVFYHYQVCHLIPQYQYPCNCDSHISTSFMCDSLGFHIILLLYVVIIVISVFANILVLFAICLNRKLHTVPNMIIRSLCTVDILLSIVGIPIMIHIYHHSECSSVVDNNKSDILWCIPNFFFTCSLHHILLLTSDRFIAIVIPLHYTTSYISDAKYMKFFITFIWGFNISWYAPVLVLDSFHFNLFENEIYYTCTYIICYAIPFVLIVAMHVWIFSEILNWRTKRLGGLHTRGAVTIFWIFLALFITFVPGILYGIIHYYLPTFFDTSAKTQRLLSASTNCLKVFNCFLNPLIYSLKMKSFKSTLVKKINLCLGRNQIMDIATVKQDLKE